MNILNIEEMNQTEKDLLSIQINQSFALPPLDPSLQHRFRTFASALFPSAAPLAHIQISHLIKNAQNLRQGRKDQANSTLRILAYTAFSIIFPASKDQLSQENSINSLLLETLKCSLYSKDVNFNQVANRNFPVDNLQAKAMIARFFNFLTNADEYSNLERIKYVEWAFESHPLLLELFVLYFRIILATLDVEGANDYTHPLLEHDTLANLIDFFDINSRSFGDLILFPEDNYFLASVEGSFVVGQYFQNSAIKHKEDNKNVEEGKTAPQQLENSNQKQKNLFSKKNGVFNSDVKLFNFLLESGRSSLSVPNERDKQIETPHFHENNQFAFGRKRKEDQFIVRQEELKKEFEKVILNISTQSAQLSLAEYDDYPVTPVIGGQYALSALNSNDEISCHHHTEATDIKEKSAIIRNSILNQKLMDSPINELTDDHLDYAKINPEQQISVKDKHFTTFSPPINKNYLTQNFSSFANANEASFLDQDPNNDFFKSSSGKIAELARPFSGDCKCVQLRKVRNAIFTKVIEIMFIPSRMKISTYRSPKFLNNLKHSQNINFNSPKITVTPPKSKEGRNFEEQEGIIREVRTPKFIKYLKKDKDKTDKYSISSKSKSKSKPKSKCSGRDQSHSPNQQKSRYQLDKETISKINNKFAKYSTILSKSPNQNKSRESKSTARKNESSSLSKRIPTEQGGMIKRFDSQFFNTRPGLGKNNNWKSSSNFHQPPYSNIQRKPHQDYEENGPQDRRGQIMRVYAPVHIIAPTVYFNGSIQKDNKVIFKVNDNCERSRIMQMKGSQNMQRGEPFRFNSNHCEKGMSYYAKQFN